jgi:YggT family protein
MNSLAIVNFIIVSIVKILILLTVLLMIVRLIINFVDVNPFSALALNVRRLSDPLVNPIRRQLLGFGADPKYAPLIVILLVILSGFFCISLINAVLNMIYGVMYALQMAAPSALIGYILYGMLLIYSLLIFFRIVFSWGNVDYRNPVMRLLVKTTEPLMGPLRRVIPPLGIFDISPIVAFILLMLFQSAIAGTLLRGFPLAFF